MSEIREPCHPGLTLYPFLHLLCSGDWLYQGYLLSAVLLAPGLLTPGYTDTRLYWHQGIVSLYLSFLLLSQPGHLKVMISSLLVFVTGENHPGQGFQSPGNPSAPTAQHCLSSPALLLHLIVILQYLLTLLFSYRASAQGEAKNDPEPNPLDLWKLFISLTDHQLCSLNLLLAYFC